MPADHPDPGNPQEETSMNSTPATFGVLELLKETKISQLLGAADDERFEASGVCTKNDSFYIIFDNSTSIARIGPDLQAGRAGNQLISPRELAPNYEEITYDRYRRRFYFLVEAEEYRRGVFKARIEEYDEKLQRLSSKWADFRFEHANKGFEGLSCVRRGGVDYLLCLCEGNKCQGGAAGARRGGGRIPVFRQGDRAWQHVATIKLPKFLPFEDYAALDVRRGRLAVASQSSSQLWVGTLAAKGWEIAGEGRVYHCPKDDSGRTVYCNVEGIAWLDADRLLAVSDRMKAGEQHERCRGKDQSIHIFRIPKSA